MAEKNNDTYSKWEGQSTAELKDITAEQLWPLFEDFCAIDKWVPALDSEKCRQVEGAYGEPGLVRHCVFTEEFSQSFFNDSDKASTRWCNEKLLSMDRVRRTFSYEITENNLGFKSYVGNMKVTEIDGGCKIGWSFTSDPAEGMRLEDLKGFVESSLKILVEEIRKEFQAPAN